MAVERTINAARDLQANIRQQFPGSGVIEHFVGVARHLVLIMQPLHLRNAPLVLIFGQREREAARLLVSDVDCRLVLQRRGKPCPASRGALRPCRVFGQPEPLRLYPDQRKIAARRAIGIVALIKHCHALAQSGEAPGNGGADQPATNDRDLCLFADHLPAPMNRRSRPKRRSSMIITITVRKIKAAETEVTSGSILYWM